MSPAARTTGSTCNDIARGRPDHVAAAPLDASAPKDPSSRTARMERRTQTTMSRFAGDLESRRRFPVKLQAARADQGSGTMSRDSGNRRGQRGQVLPIFLFCLVALMGISALVVDAGYWYREKRQLQAAVDASALAGAQGLPDKDAAVDLATNYASKNGLDDPQIAVSTANYKNDTIEVKASKPVQGIFSRVLNVASVTV